MYFEHALKYFNLWDLHSLDISLPHKAQISKYKELLMEEEAQFMVDKPFCLLLGTLLWGSSSTWPNISYVCNILGQVQVNPVLEHWELLLEVCHYICGILDYSLLYFLSLGEEVGDGIKLFGCIDTDWAGCVNIYCSISEYVFFMGRVPISWSSKQQAIVALLLIELEYISLVYAAQ